MVPPWRAPSKSAQIIAANRQGRPDVGRTLSPGHHAPWVDLRIQSFGACAGKGWLHELDILLLLGQCFRAMRIIGGLREMATLR